ncbi:alternative oxidase-domain-containing protein [Endogone sp. FLAS-F59071]|nr:alternative oxidase-domain-containing protein [Endogone sp. FLAS-F59071]|eukprot:RUS20232.1 alternative oxidase-domain-containing protein [Endogone sp. FLAS-F59071]
MFKPLVPSSLTTATRLALARPLPIPLAKTLSRPLLASIARYQSTSSLSPKTPDPLRTMPVDMIMEIQTSKPLPMRTAFTSSTPVTTEFLESVDVGEKRHRVPQTWSDAVAYYAVQMLRYLPDTYFRNDHYMRAVMLETVAAVPGMIGGMLRHLKSLRRIEHDGGWIIHLLHEAENERMHLLTWMKLLKPSKLDRLLVLAVQGIFFNGYFIFYLISPRTAHRFAGYLEEQAVISYTHFLHDLDNGLIKNEPAPRIAKEYYNLQPDATVRDVVLAIRTDEALHRDSNHHMSDRIAAHREDLREDVRRIVEDPEWKEKFGNYTDNADVKWK